MTKRKFYKGDRVVLNHIWKKNNIPRGERGIVTRTPYRSLYRVMLDGKFGWDHRSGFLIYAGLLDIVKRNDMSKL